MNDLFHQRFIDDVGVLVAMVSITLIAVIVVIIKVVLVHTEVSISLNHSNHHFSWKQQ